MSNQQLLIKQGFCLINQEEYFANEKDFESLSTLKNYYQTSLQPDGPRRRAYLKLEWDRLSDTLTVSKNQNYFQSSKNNNADGGKVRVFQQMTGDILKLPILQRLIQVNKSFINQYAPMAQQQKLILGLHFIEYVSQKHGASYSSPVGLHRDDEPLVFVHLVDLSPEALGGDNLIARLSDQEITHVIRLEKPMETIVLNNNCYHAVTPLGSRENQAVRDIILFTVEPETTQLAKVA